MENWGVPKLKGRGMVKWQAFKSLPEQYEIIGQMIEEQYKVPKPFLTDDTKERIERGLNESWQNAKEILVSYYRNGYIHEQYITVTNIDVQSKTIVCTDAFQLNMKFKVEDFVDVN
ncbi:YolD-like family protein [Bacillus tropicus]|uniref:YolD-like family protein n=1 Tax=Bacillus tropicus TaxID=2026188 RepID=UPI001E392FFA|nr:YolD-like family protein [Bacillus tropicus]MCC1486766.1 YolD-like family protein [Bacillus tropicus]